MEVVLFAHWIVNLPSALKGLGESSVVAPLLAMCRAVSLAPALQIKTDIQVWWFMPGILAGGR